MFTGARQCIGIDLGTSNSALAISLSSSGAIKAVPVLQDVSITAQADRTQLPSTLFSLPVAERELVRHRLPWEDSTEWCVGEMAEERGVLLPGRVVVSAKSWLCHRLVDRRSPILPWSAENDVSKISPYEASIRILRHLRGAVSHALSAEGLDTEALMQTPLVLTVPASFEESARALTYDAAIQAGFGTVTLLEEPLAALYAWLEAHVDSWREQLSPGDVVLVCDVGGGTSDFSLVTISEEAGELAFRRVSVGNHILLGGDNMDLALAHHLRQRLHDDGKEIDQWQFMSLVQGSRIAKETLLSDEERSDFQLSLPTRGGSLFASSISITVSRADVEQIILDGFFPLVSLDEGPRERKQGGLRELGLPYSSDPAITRHLAKFLSESTTTVAQNEALSHLLRDGRIAPTKILFNGGVFGSASFQRRIVEQLEQWSSSQQNSSAPVVILENPDLGGAVARGAAYYGGVVTQGFGLRIRAGLSRSYYLGVEPTELAVPGMPLRVKGLCLAPQGLEEGTECVLEGREFVLATGEEVEFRLFTSSERGADVPGTEAADAESMLVEGTPIRGKVLSEEPFVAVQLRSRVTEVGTLEISMRQKDGSGNWKFEFDVRGEMQ
jgi:hypothetical protein